MLDYLLYDIAYHWMYLLTLAYFLLLYFVVGPIFIWTCKQLEKRGWTNKIVNKEVPARQINFELKHSVKSIILFGFSSLPILYLIRLGAIDLLADTWYHVILGVLILTIWNEIHFFIVHRIMHIPFFMKHVHYIHHKSRIPTVYSVYCFHWFEATLLSTVPLTIVIFLPFAPLAIALYPLASILLNFAGHCNYRFGTGKGRSWQLFGTHHNEHHSKGKRNYGFASNILDKVYSRILK